MGLSPKQITDMQKALGVTSDGMWGRDSMAAAGGLTAAEAWEAMKPDEKPAEKSDKKPTVYGGVFSVSEFRHLLQQDPDAAKEYANAHMSDMSDEDYKYLQRFLK